ncbi:MAG: T9SS type A sorting domain-containing protein [Phaeodactylibacter sp.]|nr:T9SS type A sorting domain-containing protein [Phaeodactylibacter sp.]
MKKQFTCLIALCAITTLLHAQDTGMRVYEIFQNNCITCHNNADPTAGLDLEGSGATIEEKALEVYGNIFNVTPANSYAAGQGYKYIAPGRPDRSFLFRKVNNGLEPTIALHANAGANMPNDLPPISEVERELIRQWILFGAPTSGEVIDEGMLEAFYDGSGDVSFTEPPAGPDPSEGFQVKMGPFYLAPAGQPGSELEYFQKYALNLLEDVEVNRIEILISPYSHHFIIYDWDSPQAANTVPDGLRVNPYHNQISLVAAVQEEGDLKLPEGTAFRWENDLVLDLNSHYINYSASTVYQAEAYLNIYTQPTGTAAQEMHTRLLVNDDILIPNNGDPISFTHNYTPNLGEVYMWAFTGHTHKYGTGYQAFYRNNFVEGDLFYDGSCAQGIPGCVSPFFDYQHIPWRFFEPLQPVTMNTANGITHKGFWVNDGPQNVWFGPTSDDEMMVAIMMFTMDSTGVVISKTEEPVSGPGLSLRVQPNPMQESVLIALPENLGAVQVQLFDLLGRECLRLNEVQGQMIELQRGELQAGLYILRIEDAAGKWGTTKLRIE